MKRCFVKILLLLMSISMTGCGGDIETAVFDLLSGKETVVAGNGNDSEIETLANDEKTTEVTTESNSAPTIDGAPLLAVRVGETYHFTPSAADTENDDLTFTISNKPDWISFDPTSGELSGTPSRSDAGNYSAIVVSVTDGDKRASLGSFDLIVRSSSTILSWTAPTTRTDGSPISMAEIAGYRIYIGTSATDLSLFTEITDPYTMEHEIDNLEDGTYYFAISTYSVDNMESSRSIAVSKII